ncbi:MAG: GntR-family transcriptional regulator [Blastococcus sp.]|nr:GntR-family transcriptional regulator [Blastococcus sp.]
MTGDDVRRGAASPDSPAVLAEAAPIARGELLSEQASDLIRNSIVSGAILPGTRFSAAAMARQLGVSVTPVRDALTHLREAGLVDFSGGVYTIVAATEQALRDAFALREALDGMCARLACENRTPEEAEHLEQLARRSMAMAGERDLGSFRQVDAEFHHAVARYARSPNLTRYLRNAYDLALTLRNLKTARTEVALQSAHLHLAVASAIARGDADEAERLARDHVRSVLTNVLAPGRGAGTEASEEGGE